MSCSVRIQRNIRIRNAINRGRLRALFSMFGSSVPYRTMTKKTSPWMVARAEPHAPRFGCHITTFTTRFAVLNCTPFRGIRHCPRFSRGWYIWTKRWLSSYRGKQAARCWPRSTNILLWQGFRLRERMLATSIAYVLGIADATAEDAARMLDVEDPTAVCT